MKKKSSIKKVLFWLKDAGLKALVILLIVAAGFYAYAAINWPVGEPNPTTGVVGMFVGATENTFDDSQGYNLVNAWCATGNVETPEGTVNNLGAHICTPDEMVNSYNHGTLGVSPIFTYSDSNTLWINSGPPGFMVNANDCVGWTTASAGPDNNPNMGAVWNFVSDKGNLLKCQPGKQFACCK